jgi:hypothetical protein
VFVTPKSSKNSLEWPHPQSRITVARFWLAADLHDGALTGTVMMIEFESKQAADALIGYHRSNL